MSFDCCIINDCYPFRVSRLKSAVKGFESEISIIVGLVGGYRHTSYVSIHHIFRFHPPHNVTEPLMEHA
jgi:hypothetical protein